MSYATPTQMLERFDARVLGDLCADDGTRVSAANLLTDDNLQAALDDASAAIDAALRASDRYSVEQLDALATEAQLANGNANFDIKSSRHLVRVTCAIALMYLADRRLYGGGENQSLNRVIEQAKQYVKDLQSGKDIFDIGQAAEYGKPQVSGPTTAQLDNLNLVTRRTRNYYPTSMQPDNR